MITLPSQSFYLLQQQKLSQQPLVTLDGNSIYHEKWLNAATTATTTTITTVCEAMMLLFVLKNEKMRQIKVET